MKYFWNILLQTSRFNQKYQSFMVSNFHICYYQYYSSGKVSPPFIRCFFTNIIYFQQLYTIYGTLDGHILLTEAIYYFRRLYITFDGYILLLALPDCDFVRIQDFITISRTYGLNQDLFQFQFVSLNTVLLFLQFNGFFYKFQCTLLKILFCQKYSNAENVKFCSACATNVSLGKEVSQQYI